MNSSAEIRSLVDKIFSLQWCRENLVVPIGLSSTGGSQQAVTIAIGNFSYLGTIGDFVKQRAASAGYECQFIEKPAHEIQALLDQATQERLVSDSSLNDFEFSDDDVLDALKEAATEDGNQGINFDFDDSDEQIFDGQIDEEEAFDLST